MGSSIRNLKNLRITPRVSNTDYRDSTNGGDLPKTYDTGITLKSSNTRPAALTGEPSNTDQQVDHAHVFLREVAAPRIQTMSANAASVDRRYFYYYKRKHTGRRCSCFSTETSPDSACPVCLATGIVGGYEKHGTITEIVDYTTPNLLMVNMVPTLNENTRPVFFKLEDGYNYGYIEADIPIRANNRKVDAFLLSQPIFNSHTDVAVITNVVTPITKADDFIPFLSSNNIRIRFSITRGDARPLISHFLLRYQTMDDLRIYGDITQSEEAPLTMSPMGVVDTYQEIGIFFDSKTIRRFDNDDVLFRLRDGRKFKIVKVEEKIVADLLTSTDCRARYFIPDLDKGAFNLLI